MIKALFDTNIILDIALKREPYFEYAAGLFELIDKNKIIGYVSSTTITDIYYISKKEKGHSTSINFIFNLVEIVEVVGVDKEIILNALNSGMKDFEDAVQDSTADFNKIEYIITRNLKDFKGSKIKISNPKDFVEDLSSQ